MAPVSSGMEIFEVQDAYGIVTQREAGCEGGGTSCRVLAAPWSLSRSRCEERDATAAGVLVVVRFSELV